MNGELTEREREILDMWPRYEDGEPVWFGDELVHKEQGHRFPVVVIELMDDGWRACCQSDGVRDVFRPAERVKRPVQSVLDADGVPIYEGDTVWHCNGLASGVVTSIDADSLMHTTRYVDGSGTEFRDAARNLTHARPDSWERLEEDAAKHPCDYAEVVKGREFSDCDDCPWWGECGGRSESELMVRDIIRRAKKLAGVER